MKRIKYPTYGPPNTTILQFSYVIAFQFYHSQFDKKERKKYIYLSSSLFNYICMHVGFDEMNKLVGLEHIYVMYSDSE